MSFQIGSPVMLVRNLDVERGLCNGTRMQIIRFSKNKHHLVCRILTGPNTGKIEFIHRINIEYGTQRRKPLKFRRLQFPVRLCFAMTVNKAQGQSLKRVGLNLEMQQCFSHGQVYVSMSRVSCMSGIKVFSPTSSAPNRILNIVYKPILEEIDLDSPVSIKDHEQLRQKDITDFMIPPRKSPNRTQLDVCDSTYDESMEVDIEPSNASATINTVQINDDAMDCEIVKEIPRTLPKASTKNQVPRTPRNRRRAYIRDVRGDGNCFFR